MCSWTESAVTMIAAVATALHTDTMWSAGMALLLMRAGAALRLVSVAASAGSAVLCSDGVSMMTGHCIVAIWLMVAFRTIHTDDPGRQGL